MSMHEVHIDERGRFLHAVALPYNEIVFMISPGKRGERIAHREMFDEQSLQDIGALYGTPILLNHDEGRPIGRILSSRSTERGLEIEGELLGSTEELDSVRSKAGGGVLARMSIGFIPNQKADEWQKPDTATGLPLCIRRQARIKEASLVVWPAYDGAKVLGIHERTRAAVTRKAESDAAIAAVLPLLNPATRARIKAGRSAP
jgi:HK97 family phage prohead protease